MVIEIIMGRKYVRLKLLGIKYLGSIILLKNSIQVIFRKMSLWMTLASLIATISSVLITFRDAKDFCLTHENLNLTDNCKYSYSHWKLRKIVLLKKSYLKHHTLLRNLISVKTSFNFEKTSSLAISKTELTMKISFKFTFQKDSWTKIIFVLGHFSWNQSKLRLWMKTRNIIVNF